ncbi:hypothetical protein [Isobaculum melis]|uniref:Uncharacterized protein n=1 Tax=Isobaculum melis TaxID=142588 RepID=A0A1H9UJ68_9LACT|nr:hypothetical protein [Isobaculum melis]SES09476.1 hypothetical protein SAMN04488559_13311 [Isobaculum melis]
MAVKLDNINALNQVSTLLNDYSKTVDSALNEANKKFSAKVEGQKAEAIEKYIAVMNNLSKDVFTNFPSEVTSTGQAMAKYYAEITGEGFSQKVRSSSPEVDDIYCEKLTNTQIPQITDEANEIKKVLSDIMNDGDIAGEISLGSPVSTIDTAVNSFDEELRSKITAIKVTRTNLHSANKTFITELEQVKVGLDKCLVAINRVTTMTDPTNGLAPKDVLQLIIDGHFDADNIEGYLNSVNAKDDAKAVKYLANGEYDKFFELNPDNLSDGIYATAIDKLSRMIEIPSDGKIADLEDVLNALLRQGDEKNMDKHSVRLSAMGEMMALQNANLMSTMDPSHPDYEKLNSQFNKYCALSYLTMAVGALSTPSESMLDITNAGSAFSTWFSIEKLNINKDGEISFSTFENSANFANMKNGNSGLTKHPVGEIRINRHGNTEPGGDMAGFAEKMAEINKQKQEALDNLITSSAVTIGGIFHPGLGAGIGFLTNLANGDFSKLKDAGVDKLAGYTDYKDYISGINSMGEDLINFQNKITGLSEKERETAQYYYNKLLGAESISIHGNGGTMKAPGIQDVHATQNLQKLNESGLIGYLTPEALKDKFKNDERTLNDAEKYLIGTSDKKLEDLKLQELDDALNVFGQTEREELFDWLAKQGWR